MLNRIVLIGRNCKDCELRYTPNGAAVASFTLAVDRARKNAQGEKETDFINCIVWGKLGEITANYLQKGKLAAVEGELHIRSFNSQDGQKKWITEVVCDNVRFLSPKNEQQQGSNALGNTVSFNDQDIPF